MSEVRKHGLYVDGEKAAWKGRMRAALNSPTRLLPRLKLRPGQKAEAWSNGRLLATFVEHDGYAVCLGPTGAADFLTREAAKRASAESGDDAA